LKKVGKAISFFTILVLFSMICLSTNVYGATEVTLSSTAQTETTVTLSWTKSGDLLFSNYKVKMAYSVNGPWTTITTINNKDTTAYAVTGLNQDTEYYFAIQDTDTFGDATSNALEVKTKKNPTISITSRTQTTVSLRWTDYNTYSSQVPFESYVIQMSTSGASYSTLTTITDVTQRTYTVTGLSPATYYFRMYDKVGTSGQYVSYSDEASVKINPEIQLQISCQSTSVEVGQRVQLTATTSGGTNSYYYQWYANGNPISSATSASCSYTPTETGTIQIYATAQDAQDYYLDTATSNSITLTVTAKPSQQDSNGDTSPNQDYNNQGTSDNQGIPTAIIVIVAVVIIAVVGVAGLAIRQKQGKSKTTS
jgi:hypothetical protein